MILRLPAPRLLPVTIAALAALLAVKAVDLTRVALTGFGPPPGGMVAAAQAAPEKPAATAPEKPSGPTASSAPPMPGQAGPQSAAAVSPASASADAASPGTAGIDVAPAPPVSDGERAVLLELRQRRQELDGRELLLTARESVLAAAEQKFSARVEELAALQKKLEALEAARTQREEAGWQGLVKLYEAMKPRDAAAIFNELQMPVLLPVLDRMKEAKAASILAAMVPDKAREVTARLAELRTRRETPGSTTPKGVADSGG
jgi:flagellar motility protein MotE (MotC chaperone)